MKTFSAKPADVTRKWYVVDASEVPLGRLATVTASLLLGKGKPTITSHVDGGDFVIVINSDQLVVTGNKLNDKMYYHHSHYPGGLTETKLSDKIAKDSTTVIQKAVRGMLPSNKLRDGRLQRLKVYTGPEHQHEAQKPETMSLRIASKIKKESK
ncbi:MAG: 50S ribosomal protein L13 [Candidatus Saccharibacteria bacterium]|nr:50S ribosomal protein L13 [Candidatus Saccharibacteria bacterium]